MTLHEALSQAQHDGGSLRVVGVAVAVLSLVVTVLSGMAVGFYKLGQVSNSVQVNTFSIAKNEERLDKISDNQLEVRLDLASQLQQLQDQQSAINAQLKALLEQINGSRP